MATAVGTHGYRIERPEQVKVLESTVCQEIVDLVEATGASSVREMAGFMGRRPDSLYYHVRKLLDAGLLVDHGIRGSGRRAESVYDVPKRPLRLAYEPADAANVRAVSRVMTSMLRSASRDFRSGFRPPLAVVEGEDRNLWAARMKGWLTDEELRELNALLDRILDLFQESKGPEGRKGSGREAVGAPRRPRSLHSLTWILTPIEATEAPGGQEESAT